jgi:outer membrane protein TolC
VIRNALLALSAIALLSACATQTYAPAPIAPEELAADFHARRLDSAELQAYMRSQGYPQDTLPIKLWGLHELTLAAFYYHPRLELARARVKQAEAAIITAGRRPNPGISADVEHHSDTPSGDSPWTLGFALDIPVETAGKRDIRLERAAAISNAARLEVAQSAWEIRSQLRARLLDYATSEQTVALLQRESDTQQEIVTMLEKRLAAGMVSHVDLSNARLQWQKTRQALAGESGRLPPLRAAIAAACGLPESALAGIKLDSAEITRILPPAALPATEIQSAALLNRLDIRAGLARYAASEAALKLEIAKQHPDVTFSPGYMYDQGDRLWTLGLSLLLGLLDRNEGPIAEADAQRKAEAAQFNLLQTRVIGELEQFLAGYQAAHQKLTQAEQLLAAQRARHQQITRQLDAGYTDRLELTSATLEMLVAERGVQEATMRTQQALGQLEDTVQRPLDTSLVLALPEQ